MHILLLGGGGREHALALAMKSSVPSPEIFVAPGNPGMAEAATLVKLDMLDPYRVAAWAIENDIDLVVVGPEAPLVAGVADALAEARIPCFGPSAAAAKLEGSKAFAKQIMRQAGVATASARVCTNTNQVIDALDEFGVPYVVKADGLAAGKGVLVTEDRGEAMAHAQKCLDCSAGRVVVEEYLDGPEVSLFCICDGTRVVPLTPAQDFKRAYEGGRGPNTGGMGAYAPLPWAPADLQQQVVDQVAQPVVDQMAGQGTPFVGLLYCGLALTTDGIKVVEFNVRFGDPETQVVAALEGGRLTQLMYHAALGKLAEVADVPPACQGAPDARAAVTVVVANEGYPGELAATDRQVRGVAAAARHPGVRVIHAGTTRQDGKLLATGGRVLNIVALGADVAQARQRAYTAIADIQLQGSFYRADIADIADITRAQRG